MRSQSVVDVSIHPQLLVGWIMPAYKVRLKQQAPIRREVARWMDHSVAALQDTLDDTDWDMFQHSSDDINMLTEAVVGFISYSNYFI